MNTFTECDTCRAKPGHPTLCGGCLSNRGAISLLTAQLRVEQNLNKDLRDGIKSTLRKIKEFLEHD